MFSRKKVALPKRLKKLVFRKENAFPVSAVQSPNICYAVAALRCRCCFFRKNTAKPEINCRPGRKMLCQTEVALLQRSCFTRETVFQKKSLHKEEVAEPEKSCLAVR